MPSPWKRSWRPCKTIFRKRPRVENKALLHLCPACCFAFLAARLLPPFYRQRQVLHFNLQNRKGSRGRFPGKKDEPKGGPALQGTGGRHAGLRCPGLLRRPGVYTENRQGQPPES